MGGGPFCLMSYQIMQEDMDVVSVYFKSLDRVSVLVQSDMPSVTQCISTWAWTLGTPSPSPGGPKQYLSL